MSTQQDIVAVIVISLLGLSLPCLAGGKPMYTERPVEELKLMTTPELAGDARPICEDILAVVKSAQSYRAEWKKRHDGRFYDKAVKADGEATRGRRYLERVGLVIRDRHRGQMPTWFEELSRAVENRNQPDCNTAATAGGWRPKQ